MKDVVAIQYTDAICFEKPPKDIALPIYRCVGLLGEKTDDHVRILFSLKNGHPQEGLIIPNEALILNNAQDKTFPALEKIKTGDSVGVVWKDIVHFTDGKIPKTCSTMYTEGVAASISKDAIALHRAQTIRVYPGKTRPHHKQNTSSLFCVLPKQLIVTIEIYE